MKELVCQASVSLLLVVRSRQRKALAHAFCAVFLEKCCDELRSQAVHQDINFGEWKNEGTALIRRPWQFRNRNGIFYGTLSRRGFNVTSKIVKLALKETIPVFMLDSPRPNW